MRFDIARWARVGQMSSWRKRGKWRGIAAVESGLSSWDQAVLRCEVLAGLRKNETGSEELFVAIVVEEPVDKRPNAERCEINDSRFSSGPAWFFFLLPSLSGWRADLLRTRRSPP